MFLKSQPQFVCYAPIDLKKADIYIRDGFDNTTNTPTTTGIVAEGEVDIALSNMDTKVPDPAVTTGVTVKFGSDTTEYSVTAVVDGAGTAEQQTIEIDDDVDGGTFTLTFGGYPTGTIAWDASAVVVQAALQALTSIGLGNATVTKHATRPIWTVTFAGTLAATDVALMTGNGAALTSGDATDVEIATSDGVDAVTEVVLLTATVALTVGHYHLIWDSKTTGPITFDATAEEVEMALKSLDGIEVGDVTVVDSGTWPTIGETLTVTFTGDLALQSVPDISADVTGLTGTLDITFTPQGVDGVIEVVTVGINDSVTGGTFTLTETQTTVPILYNATSVEVAAALNALAAIVTAGGVTVTGGPGPATDWVITYVTTGDKDPITVGDENLTGGSGTAVSIVETVKGVTGTGTSQITVSPVLAAATTVGGSVTFGGRKLEIKVGEGNVNFTENTPREYLKNRGLLDTVRNADEEPMDVTFDFTWEFLSAVGSSATPTIKEALKQTGEALTWISTSDDACEPYCSDIEIFYDPECGDANTEKVELNEFRPETLEHNLRDAQISCAGKCNVTGAVETRGA